METIKQADYYQQIAAIAEEGIAEARKDGRTGDAAREAFDTWLWETIDGHQWVIYTYYAQQVTCISQNDGYTAEHFGPETVIDQDGIRWSAVAFGAMYADVMHRVSDVEWDREEEDTKAEALADAREGA